MKKKLLVLSMVVGITAAAALSGCTGKENSSLTDARDVYGMGAVSTVRLLGSSVSTKAVTALAKSRTVIDESSSVTDTVKAQANKFNEYFTALDSFLGDDVISTSTVKNNDDAYPYDLKMTVNGKDFNGDSVVYTMYYSETLVKVETDNDETESEYELTGVMVIDGKDYYLEGERKLETEKDETENEIKFRAYADKNDRLNFVEMEQENSVENNENETEYVYSIYSNGKLIEKTAVEFETKKTAGIEKTEYELEFRQGAARGKYKVKREVQNNKVTMKVKYNIDGNTGEFKIREVTGKDGQKHYEYTFSDNTTKVL